MLEVDCHLQFSVNLDDDYTASLTLQVSEWIKLMVVGLGDEDVLDSPLCGHGQVAPLKWYKQGCIGIIWGFFLKFSAKTRISLVEKR